MKSYLLLIALAVALVVPAAAQQVPQAPPPQPEAQQQPAQNQQPAEEPILTYDARQDQKDEHGHEPLEVQRREGFWGKLNPFARKKYVERQVEPLRNRVGELDELTAANARAIRDLDARAQQGIRKADLKATEADQKATQAGERAEQAHTTARQASERLQTVEQVVENLDAYYPVTQAEIRFRSGQTALSAQAKAALDEIAGPVKQGRGYVVEIHGYAPGQGRAGMEHSQMLAQAVARYLVIEHQVPVHRIYAVGLGNTATQGEDGRPRRVTGGGRVEVNLLKNSLEDLQPTVASSSR